MNIFTKQKKVLHLLSVGVLLMGALPADARAHGAQGEQLTFRHELPDEAGMERLEYRQLGEPMAFADETPVVSQVPYLLTSPFVSEGIKNGIRQALQHGGEGEALSLTKEEAQPGMYTITEPTQIGQLFKDPVLADVMAQLLEKESVDAVVEQTELDHIWSINYWGTKEKHVRELEGVQYLPNLKVLQLPVNGVADLTPLQTLKKLVYLDLQNNALSDISPIRALENLAYLFLGNPGVVPVPEGAPAEAFLDNNISDIGPLEALTSLMVLTLGGNEIGEVDALSKLEQLVALELTASGITDIAPLTKLGALNSLFLGHNTIKDVSPLGQLTELEGVLVNDNGAITDITSLQTLHNLKGADLSGNQISDIGAARDWSKITSLYLQGNNITDMRPLASHAELGDLDVSNNNIEDMSTVQTLQQLVRLDLSGNKISDISAISEATNLVALALAYNNISDMSSVHTLVKLTALALQGNELRKVTGVDKLTDLQALNLSGNVLDDVSALARLTGLEKLDLADNDVRDIGAVSALVQLKILNLGGRSGNHVRDISPVAKLQQLEQLGLANNDIIDVTPLSGLEALKVIDLTNNKIKDMTSFAKLDRLVVLGLAGNQLADLSQIDDWSMPELTLLVLYDNYITDLRPLRGRAAQFPRLEMINIDHQSNERIPSVPYAEDIEIENTIKSIDGSLVAPMGFTPAASGTYGAPYVHWRIERPADQVDVAFNWGHEFMLGGKIPVAYSGQYTVHVTPDKNSDGIEIDQDDTPNQTKEDESRGGRLASTGGNTVEVIALGAGILVISGAGLYYMRKKKRYN